MRSSHCIGEYVKEKPAMSGRYTIINRHFAKIAATIWLSLICVSVRADNTVDCHVPVVDGYWPPYFSGTNCTFDWSADTGQNKYHWIKQVVIKIGGETAKVIQYPDPEELPSGYVVNGTIVFDSTEFADDTLLLVTLDATDNLGNVGHGLNMSPVYNKALVLGNQNLPFGYGTAEVNDVSLYTQAMHHTTLSSDARTKANIQSIIPVYTVF